MSNRAWLGALLAAALVGWGAGGAGLLAYVNWFSETGRSGGGLVWAASAISLLVGLGATVAFFALGVFEIVDRMRSHA
jgi:hypothetical protein